MRVVAGSARGRVLRAPNGDRVRPTADRVKEALFSSLVSRFGALEGLSVLDLFAGTGNLGIEALSRGASKAVFIDNSSESLQFLRKNLDITGLCEKAEVIRADAVTAVKQLAASAIKFSVILADPPYAALEIANNLLKEIISGNLICDGGIIIFETDRRAIITVPDGLAVTTRKVYGDTALHFLEQNLDS